VTPKHPPGPPMTLGNMRERGVRHLIAFCHWPMKYLKVPTFRVSAVIVVIIVAAIFATVRAREIEHIREECKTAAFNHYLRGHHEDHQPRSDALADYSVNVLAEYSLPMCLLAHGIDIY
jgi:hypothetical protein